MSVGAVAMSLSTIIVAGVVLLDRASSPVFVRRRGLGLPRGSSERFRVGTSHSALEPVVRSGLWASLSAAQCTILGVLDTFADGPTRTATLSYRAIMRYAGVRSHSTVSAAVKPLSNLKIIQAETAKDGDGFRACCTYRLCLDDPEFLLLANDSYKKQQEDASRERELRAVARRKRKAELRTRP